MNSITQKQLDDFKNLYPRDGKIQGLTLTAVLQNTAGKSGDWTTLTVNDEKPNVLKGTLSECEKSVGFVVFDVMCLAVGAYGLRSTVKASTIEAMAEASRPLLSKLEVAIARVATEGASKTDMAKGVFEILKTIVSGGSLGAVFSAFTKSLTWWDMVLYGITGTATIVAAVATDGLAFAAEIAIELATFGFLASDSVKMVNACNIVPAPSGKPYTTFGLHYATVLAASDFDSGRFVIFPGQGDAASDDSDLYCVKQARVGAHRIELHVANAKDRYSSWKVHAATALADTETGLIGYFAGDYGRHNPRDLYYLKAGTEGLEVHILNASQNYGGFMLQEKAPIHSSDLMYFNFALGNFHNDGVPDLYCIKRKNTASMKLEIHVLSGKSKYQEYTVHATNIDLPELATGKYKFMVGRYNRVVGKSDLYMLKCDNTGSGKIEVSVLDANSGFNTLLLTSQPTPITTQ